MDFFRSVIFYIILINSIKGVFNSSIKAKYFNELKTENIRIKEDISKTILNIGLYGKFTLEEFSSKTGFSKIESEELLFSLVKDGFCLKNGESFFISNELYCKSIQTSVEF